MLHVEIMWPMYHTEQCGHRVGLAHEGHELSHQKLKGLLLATVTHSNTGTRPAHWVEGLFRYE